MNKYTVREYRRSDIPAMTALWQGVFGDTEELIGSFMALLQDMGTAAVAELNGSVVGAAYVIAGMELIGAGARPPVCGYIYAVAVDPACRRLGIGRELTLRCAELARRRGAEVICTLPAEESLYGWYRDVRGVECVLRRRRFELPCSADEGVMELSSTEYMLWRESMLRDKCHMHPSNPTLEFQRRFCKALGGGLYACGSGICSAYLENGAAVIKELITSVPGDAGTIAASVGAFIGAERAVYFLPDVSGEVYLSALPGSIPPDCVWNISFD